MTRRSPGFHPKHMTSPAEQTRTSALSARPRGDVNNRATRSVLFWFTTKDWKTEWLVGETETVGDISGLGKVFDIGIVWQNVCFVWKCSMNYAGKETEVCNIKNLKKKMLEAC